MKKTMLLASFALCIPFILNAQETFTVTRTLVEEGNVTKTVTWQVKEKQKRITSQGDPDAHLEYRPGKAPEKWAIPLAETLMARYPDYRTAYYKDYSYVQGYAFEAFFRLYDQTGDERYLNYVKTYMDHFVTPEGKYMGGALTNLDNFMTGSAFCSLFHYTRDEKYFKAAKEILTHVDSYPASDGQFWHGNKSPNMWIDGVFMMQMYLLRHAQYIGDTDKCLDIAARNIISAARHLQREDGLVLHAWTTEPDKAVWADPETGKSPEVWSEGMGWYTLVCAELLAVMPKTHTQYASVLDIYKKMMSGLKRVQEERNGGWYMVVDKASEPLNFIDPSGTAMFTYAIARGIELGILKEKEFGECARMGYRALYPFLSVNSNGLLDVIGACDGVTIKKDFLTYVTVPKILNAKEAVVGMLWAAQIIEK